jgi:hypothetical protein
MARVKVGDIVLVGTFNESRTIAHYVVADRDRGPFVQLYQCPDDWQVGQGLVKCKALFGPLLVGIGHAVRTGRWSVLGHISPEPFSVPKFLMQGGGETWFLLDGTKETRLDSGVPTEYQNLETLSVWPAELLEERIRTGVNPISYTARRAWRL